MSEAATAPTQESSLLLTLEEVSRLISHSHDPQETLTNTVSLIQGRFRTDVCSVYLIDPVAEDLVLAATLGLDQASVGRIRMRFGEGLTGLVAERMAAVMEPDASTHPRFKYFQETGEDRYRSFLGAPIIEAGAVEGVLVVQTVERRPFTPNEVRMLVTVASQLAPLVTGARLLEQVAAAVAKPPTVEAPTGRVLQGRGLSPGVGTGRAYVVGEPAAAVHQGPSDDPAAERERLTVAMEAARDEIGRLSRRISALVGEDHGAILQAQLMILQDRSVERELESRLGAGHRAEAAVAGTLEKYVATFSRMTNPFFQERIYDIKDVFRRIAWHLRPRGDESTAPAGDDRVILVAREASVLDLLSVDPDRLAGVAVEHGGAQSHAGIMARSLGVPMVGQVVGLLEHVGPGRRLAIDGSAGTLRIDPSPAREGSDADARAHGPEQTPPPPLRLAPTPEATAAPSQAEAPRVDANVNLLGEASRVLTSGAGGVGLYRSEMIFLARRTLPTEEEQVEIYRKLVEAVRGRSVTIRTFDLRPDKLGHGSAVAAATAQALDWRLVLDSPALQRIFYEQVRAILRASAYGSVRLLVPLVNRTALLDLALETVREARCELAREGLAHDPDVPVGAMIEVAAVAPLIADWAERVDFFSLGTNDLIASALGQDRDDPVGARPDDAMHPGVVRLLSGMIEAANRGHRPISACGEMAGDPAGALMLTALGVDSLSVAVDRVGDIRRALATLPAADRLAFRDLLLKARGTTDVVRAVRARLDGACA